MALRTDYKDDVLSSGNLRKYQMINNGDGTVSFQDVTVYQQTGDTFGAGDINNTNQAVNEKLDSDDVVDPMETTVLGFAADAYKTKLQFNEQNKNLTASDNLKFRFATDGEGNYGYLKADDSFVPFKSGLDDDATPTLIGNVDTASFTAEVGEKYLITVGGMTNSTSTKYSVTGATKIVDTTPVYGTKNAGLYAVVHSFIVEATSTTIKVPKGVNACLSWLKIS